MIVMVIITFYDHYGRWRLT